MRRIAISLAVALTMLGFPTTAAAEPVDPPSSSPLFAPAEPAPGPTVAGVVQQGRILTGQQGGWEPGVDLSNDWRRCDNTTCASTGQTGQTYTLTADDLGKTLKLRVTGNDGLGFREADSPLTAVVTPLPVAPANTSAPAITGVPREGRTLSASRGSWTGTAPITYSYEWFRCKITCTPTRATGTTYPLDGEDAKTELKVVVTASNEAGLATASASSPVVTARPTNTAGRRLSPFPVVIIGGRAGRGGAVITELAVRNAPRGATVTVRCAGRDCPFGQARRILKRSPRTRLRALERKLRAGTVITVLIRRGRALGKYTRIRIRRNAPPARVDRCLSPSSRRAESCSAP